jgi:hypothetical protein
MPSSARAWPIPSGEELLHPLGELQETECIGHAGPVSAYALAHLLLRQPELLDEAAVALGLLERVEVGPLEVLDQGQLEGLGGGDIPDDGRHLVETRELGGPPPSLTGDEAVVRSVAADEDGLDDALGPD